MIDKRDAPLDQTTAPVDYGGEERDWSYWLIVAVAIVAFWMIVGAAVWVSVSETRQTTCPFQAHPDC